MSIHGKSALIIIGTLILGIVIGVVLAGALVHLRIARHLLPGRGLGGFANVFEMVIDPDEDQRDAVREIIAKYSARFEDVRIRHHADVSALMDSLRDDLEPILTEEQKARLEERHGHFRDLMGRRPGIRRDRMHPGPTKQSPPGIDDQGN